MIEQYLSLPFRQQGLESKSPYMAALMDARAATGRNVGTGAITDAQKTGNWAGALAYMALVDHIGNFLSRIDQPIQERNRFVKALKEFTRLQENEIYAIYALRCAFAHTYSLINVGQGRRANLLHHQFMVTRGRPGNLIVFPEVPWNGIRDPATHHLITTINLELLGDLVEDIHQLLLLKAQRNELEAIGELVFIQYRVG